MEPGAFFGRAHRDGKREGDLRLLDMCAERQNRTTAVERRCRETLMFVGSTAIMAKLLIFRGWLMAD